MPQQLPPNQDGPQVWQGEARWNSVKDVQRHQGGGLGSAGVVPAQQRDVIPPFQPSLGGCRQDVLKNKSLKKSDPGSLSFLENITIINPQYRALDFAKLSHYSFSSQINEDNLNLALFSYGSLKHLLALTDGTLPPVSKTEFLNRLQHLVNVFDIVCLGTPLSSFNGASWTEGHEYNKRILHDLETGVKDWKTLSRSIDSTCWTFAKINSDAKLYSDSSTYSDSDGSVYDSVCENSPRKCTSWNSFRKSGCQFEFLNPGKTCRFLHSCSTCEANGQLDMPHKA